MNKRTEEKLTLLRLYFTSRRGVGHTSALVKGIANTERLLVLASDISEIRYIARMAQRMLIPPVTWENFPDGMYGESRPLVITEQALVQILGDALEELKQSRAENYILKDMLRASYNWRNDEEA
jgi:hypothetical protein